MAIVGLQSQLCVYCNSTDWRIAASAATQRHAVNGSLGMHCDHCRVSQCQLADLRMSSTIEVLRLARPDADRLLRWRPELWHFTFSLFALDW